MNELTNRQKIDLARWIFRATDKTQMLIAPPGVTTTKIPEPVEPEFSPEPQETKYYEISQSPYIIRGRRGNHYILLAGYNKKYKMIVLFQEERNENNN